MIKKKSLKENKKLRSQIKGLRTNIKRLKEENRRKIFPPEYKELPGVGYPGSRPRIK